MVQLFFQNCAFVFEIWCLFRCFIDVFVHGANSGLLRAGNALIWKHTGFLFWKTQELSLFATPAAIYSVSAMVYLRFFLLMRIHGL